MSYAFKRPWNGKRRRELFNRPAEPWDNLTIALTMPAELPLSPAQAQGQPQVCPQEETAPQPVYGAIPAYSRADMESARAHIREFKLYPGGRLNLAIEKEAAKAIAQGIDPQAIDFKAFTSKDKPISEAIADERTAVMYNDGIW